jgi:DNA-directed RNA polymerase subunit RPC12/RpoP
MKKIICPGCGLSSRTVYLSSKDSYQCMHCGQMWERGKKLVKEKLYRCPHCGHEWQEKDILVMENVKTEEEQPDVPTNNIEADTPTNNHK